MQVAGLCFAVTPGVIMGNQIIGSRGDGILIGYGAGAPLNVFHLAGLAVTANTSTHNRGAGIRIDPAGVTANNIIDVTLTANTAVGNAGYGIESPGTVPPYINVIDGGGNVARFNGNPAQCLNVVCAQF